MNTIGKTALKIGELVQSQDWRSEKHVPVIDTPATIQQGQPFNVTVTVGKEIPHPNTTEHHIQWIALYYKPDGDKFVYHLGRSEFLSHGASAAGPNMGSSYTNPIATFNVKLDKPGMLIAVESCNIHGLWEYSTDVKF